MSNVSIPVVPPVDLSEAAEVNQPEADSERARELRKKRDDEIAEGDLPPPDIAGISEQNRGPKPR